jgi:beta-xylosidase
MNHEVVDQEIYEGPEQIIELDAQHLNEQIEGLQVLLSDAFAAPVHNHVEAMKRRKKIKHRRILTRDSDDPTP